jgi:hypothetical protein
MHIDQDILNVLYFALLGLVTVQLALSFFQRRKAADLFLLVSLVMGAFTLIGIVVVAGHVPVSGNFEKLQCVAFYILLTTWLHQVVFDVRIPGWNYSVLIAWLILVGVLFGRMEVSDNYLIYSMPEVILFFQLRMAAIAMFAYGIAMHVGAFVTKAIPSRMGAGMGRNFSLIGAALFLGGEFFGSIWAMNGWGDPWRWSGGFFLAGAMFLLSMLAAHVPLKYRRNRVQNFILSTIPLLCILLIYLL